MLAKEEAFIARFKARASHAAQVQSRVKKLEKIEKVEPPKRRKMLEFDFRAAAALGRRRREARGRRQGVRQRERSTTGSISSSAAGERWCVMGVNGAGKSTLLKLVAGATEPDAGRVDASARA